jgi:2-dehydropantoate 2-reductase
VRIIIYGAGGIGSVVGGHLWRSGQAVVLIGRAGHVSAIRKNGLKLITPTGNHILKIPAVTSPLEIQLTPDDVVFLCMKGQNTEGALADLFAVIRDVPIFCLQNGVRNEEIASQSFPRVFGAMVRIGAVYLKDGEVICRRDPPGWLVIGRYPQGMDDLAEEVARRLRHGEFSVKLTEDVMPYKWGKLMANLGNAVDAITDAKGKGAEKVVKAARQELIDLLKEASIHWISQEDLVKEWSEMRMPLKGSFETRELSSTWQSLARQQGSVETDSLNGEVVRLAKRLGQKAPVNEKLLQISQEMAANHEKPGKYTREQLASLLGLD